VVRFNGQAHLFQQVADFSAHFVQLIHWRYWEVATFHLWAVADVAIFIDF